MSIGTGCKQAFQDPNGKKVPKTSFSMALLKYGIQSSDSRLLLNCEFIYNVYHVYHVNILLTLMEYEEKYH